MAEGVNIGSAFIDIRAEQGNLKTDFEKAKASSKKAVDDMNAQLSKIKMGVDASVLKMKFSEAETLQVKLKAKLEEKIKMNADVGSIQKTKAALDSVNSSLSGVKKNQDDVVNNASKWGMIATGIQSSVQAVQQFVVSMKQLVGQSVVEAAELKVLKSNFEGTNEDLELFRKGTAGTVNDGNLIKLANQGKSLGLSMTDTALFLSLAEDKTDSLGGTVEEVMQKLIFATEGGGKGLRDAGIQVQVFNKLVEDMAKAEGGTISSLEAETQKRIRLKALIEASGITIEQVMQKQKDEKDLIEATGVKVDEARIKLGNFILNGLTPLQRKLDESSSGFQNFIYSVVAIGGIIIGAIPLVVQLYSAKKIFASASLISASAVGAETAAIEANTVAKVANSSIGTLGMLGAIGAILAVGVAVIALTSYINDNTAAIKKNREEAEKKFPSKMNIGFGDQYGNDKPDSAPGTVNLSGFLSSRSSDAAVTGNKKVAMSVSDVIARINDLTEANKKANISWKEYFRNLAEIERLQKKLTAQKPYDYSKSQLLGMTPEQVKEEQEAGTHIRIPLRKPIEKKEITKDALSEGSRYMSEEDAKENIDNIKRVQQAEENLASTLSSGFTIARIAGEGLGAVFADMGTKFADMVLQALVFKGAMAALNLIPGVGSALSWLGLGGHEGGTFTNGARIPAFAGGIGSYMVPNGFPNDSFPVMVQSGEDLRVRTPQQRAVAEMDNKAMLSELRGIRKGMGKPIASNLEATASVPIMLDGDVIGYAAVKFMNKAQRRGKNLSEIS